MYIHTNILALHPGADDETGTSAKLVDELDPTMLSEVSFLPRVSDALEKLLRVLSGNGRPFDLLLLTVQNNHRRLAYVQLQPIRSVGMNEMKKIIHRVHMLNVS
jgi:hypothetical protein